MKEPQFTPGPWTFDDTDEPFGRPAIIAKGAERYSTYGPVCLVMKRHRNYKQNAHLIAAAPEMYAEHEKVKWLLRNTADWLEMKFGNILDVALLRHEVENIDALLAKARGEEKR